MFQPPARLVTFEDYGFFVGPICREKSRHRPADGFLSRMTSRAAPCPCHVLEIRLLSRDARLRHSAGDSLNPG